MYHLTGLIIASFFKRNKFNPWHTFLLASGPTRWLLYFTPLCFIIAIAASYEMLKWWYADTLSGAAFLSSQGDICGQPASYLRTAKLHHTHYLYDAVKQSQ